LLLVAFLLVNAPNCHLSLVFASEVQGDAVNCNTTIAYMLTTTYNIVAIYELQCIWMLTAWGSQ